MLSCTSELFTISASINIYIKESWDYHIFSSENDADIAKLSYDPELLEIRFHSQIILIWKHILKVWIFSYTMIKSKMKCLWAFFWQCRKQRQISPKLQKLLRSSAYSCFSSSACQWDQERFWDLVPGRPRPPENVDLHPHDHLRCKVCFPGGGVVHV